MQWKRTLLEKSWEWFAYKALQKNKDTFLTFKSI